MPLIKENEDILYAGRFVSFARRTTEKYQVLGKIRKNLFSRQARLDCFWSCPCHKDFSNTCNFHTKY